MTNFNRKWRTYLDESELSTAGLMIQKGLHPKFGSEDNLIQKYVVNY